MSAETRIGSKRTITVEIEKDGNLYVANSPDMKGLIVFGKDLDKMREQQIPAAISTILAHESELRQKQLITPEGETDTGSMDDATGRLRLDYHVPLSVPAE
jgi:predicted RNase H-like HicB family nuclease